MFRRFLNGQNCSEKKEMLERMDQFFRSAAENDFAAPLPEKRWCEPKGRTKE
jgi:hypothetical protein